VRLTIVGCSGSFPGPDSSASCYLIEAPFEGRTFRLVLDLGSGAFGSLQRYIRPSQVDAVLLSHLHADHCFDMSAFYVVAKYHPDGAFPQIPVYSPPGANEFLTNAYGREDAAGMGGPFGFTDWIDGRSFRLGPFTVTGRRVVHPVPAFGMRIECGGSVIAYSGDTASTPVLDELARGADLFLCEASFLESSPNPPGIHLTGAEAGHHAHAAGVKRLLVTHIPAWTDRDAVAADVRSSIWNGPFELVRPGGTYEV